MSENWRKHRNTTVKNDQPTGSTTCDRCNQEWPCEVAQAVTENRAWMARNIADLIRESARDADEAACIADEQEAAYTESPAPKEQQP